MTEKQKATVLAVCAFSLAALWIIDGFKAIKIIKDLNDKEFAEKFEEGLQKDLEELEGKI